MQETTENPEAPRPSAKELQNLLQDSAPLPAVWEESKNLDALQALLQKGIVHFAFIKTDGTLREAFGTTCPDLLPPPPPVVEGKPKKEFVKNPDIVTFYDLIAKGFRSFKRESLVSFVVMYVKPAV